MRPAGDPGRGCWKKQMQSLQMTTDPSTIPTVIRPRLQPAALIGQSPVAKLVLAKVLDE